jgi:bilirubin oxidase
MRDIALTLLADYYEVEIKSVEIQIYPPPMKKARFVGYDGQILGPTFIQNKGEEAIVRFINRRLDQCAKRCETCTDFTHLPLDGDRSSSIHLHGSYSRSPFDGYADDV